MDLVRSWLGQALRATGAAVVVPIAVLVALSLTAIGGSGLGGLGAFSQVLSGPSVAGNDLTVDDGGTEIADAVTQLASANGSPSGPGGSQTLGDENGSNGPTGGGPRGTTPTPPTGGPGPGNPGPPGGPGPGPGPTPPPSTPPPSPPPGGGGVVHGVGQGLKDATSGTPVAPTVEDAVDTLVDTCGRLGCP